MENDDRQMGRLLSRRDVLKLMGITSATLLAACVPGVSSTLQPTSAPVQATPASTSMAAPAQAISTLPSPGALPACVVRPEMTEGPYYVDEDLNRSDVRSDPVSGIVKAGAPLTLTFNVSQVGAGGCTPLAGAKVEIWHCDAEGVYSDVLDRGSSTKGEKFLRGFQETDANGQTTFLTIYPGWYPGRTVHLHFKVHHETTAQSSVFTSQLFFDDTLSDRVFSQSPYAGRGQRNTLNSNDRIYNDQLLLNVTEAGKAGYTAAFDLGLEVG